MSGDWGLDRSPQPDEQDGHRSADGQGQKNRTTAPGGAVPLVPQEAAAFDPDRLERLCRTLGETCAEAEVAFALDRISTTLGALDRLWKDGDPRIFVAAVAALARDADLIGMTTLARVATSVLDCREGAADDTALAATMARLDRVGARSMHAVWDLDDPAG